MRHVFRKHKPELLGAGSLEQSAMVDMWLEVEAHQLTPAAGPVVVECVFAPFLAEEETDWRTRGRRRPTAFARAGEGGATGFARAESRRRRCQVAESAYICAWRG